jgi:D-3-phosphoglycerate dehydrogenase
MSRAIVTDSTFPDLSIEEQLLSASGVSLKGYQAKSVDALLPVVADADLIITQFAPLQRPVIEAMRRAKVIIRYGIGVDNVDLVAAREKGIPVCNIPDYCINEVADQTLAFLLAQTRQVLPNHRLIAEGKWGLAVPLTEMRALRDQTVGVVGYGRIGRAVVERLIPFGCRILVHDPLMVQGPVGGTAVTAVPLGELLSESDIVTLHCPSLDSTKKMINRQSLAQMKKGSLLINVGRGDLVDPDALLESLKSGHLAGASLDVFDPEPIPTEHPIRSLPNVILASHIASASPRAVRTLRESVAKIAVAVHQGQTPPNIVNGVRR